MNHNCIHFEFIIFTSHRKMWKGADCKFKHEIPENSHQYVFRIFKLMPHPHKSSFIKWEF
jgi:hypothetical protein